MRIKLLLADDSITIQKVVGIIFASEDYHLTIVDNGAAVLAKAREVRPDVLLVDAIMPGKTGYEVCEEIRRDQILKGTPILLLTGAFEPFDEGKARQSGADDFISKPFESQHLIDKVMGLADLSRQRAAAAPAPQPAAAPFVQVPPSRIEPPVQPTPLHRPAPPAAASAPQAAGDSPEFIVLQEEAVQGTAFGEIPTATSEFELEMVEGSAEDDLWGAFELEDVAEGETGEFDDSHFAAEVLTAGTAEVEEPLDFAEEPEEVLQETATAPPLIASQWEPGKESEFAFGMEAEPAPFGLAPARHFSEFVEEAAPEFAVSTPKTPPAEPQIDLQFASEEEYVPAPETLAAFTAPAAPSLTPAPVVAAAATLSDDQLAALVSRISRDIIEKIAWEVVPDLAERIITEEIRKIKEGA